MIKYKIIAFILLLAMSSPQVYAQKTALFYDTERHFKKGLEYFEKHLFGAAVHEFRMAQNMDFPIHREGIPLLDAKAQLMEAACLIRLGLPEGEQKMTKFLRENPNNPVAVEAILEIANYHYNKTNHLESIRFYEMVDMEDLPESLRSEASFKAGYSHFTQREFTRAIGYFLPILDIKDIYYYPSNYYYAMSNYYTGRSDLAVEGFRKVESSGYYGKLVPFYVASIHFSDKNYDRVISYLTPYAEDESNRYFTEMNLLLGQSHFENENYAEAAEYLGKAVNAGGVVDRNIRYQLGYSLYRQNKFTEAKPHLLYVAGDSDKISQHGNFYLAECYIESGDYESARNAFANALRHDLVNAITEEARFNYGKLSAELQYDREAVNTLVSIQPGSVYYAQAQEILGDVLLNSRDYERSIEIIENIESPAPTIRRAYQTVTFNRAVQHVVDNKLNEARVLFDKSLYNPLNSSLRAQALFWKAEISHRDRKFEQSIEELNQYFSIARGIRDLPENSSIPVANYLQGYNYLKIERHEVALGFFQEAVSSIRLNTVNIQDPYLRRIVLSDAMLRAGDCLFKNNRYSQALRFYNDAIEMRVGGYDYAIFQKGMILGLTNKPFDKIVLLEDLVATQPQSTYADHALFQLGITFQEMGRSAEAVNALDRLIKNYGQTSPLVNTAHLRLGLIHYNQGDNANAMHHYKQVFENNPDKREAQDALAALEEIYVNDLGQPEKYFTLVENIGVIDFSDFARDSITYRAADLQYMAGNCERAIQSYGAYISQFPRGTFLTEAFYNRGECNSILRNWNRALNDYESVISRGTGNYYIRALEKAAAISYHHSEDFQRALTHYTTLESRATSNDQRFEAQMGALRSAYRIRHKEAVNTMAAKVLDNPRAGEDQKAAAHFFKAKIKFDEKLFSDALESFNAVTRLSNNVYAAESRYRIASIYFLNNEIELAENLARAAVQENSNYPLWVARSLVLLSDILVIQGDNFNARAALEAVIEHFDEDPELVSEAREKLNRIKQLDAEAKEAESREGEGDEIKIEKP
nr:tetratricopeptide repeat protein [Saprospiraceae bacterium]